MTVYYSDVYNKCMTTEYYVDKALCNMSLPLRFGHSNDGRPIFLDSDDYTISIAHSNSVIIIAIDSYRIGVDVEYIKYRKNYSAVANKIGLSNVCNIDDFYREWTKYEATYKANLSSPHIKVYYNIIPDYIIAIASEMTILNVEFVRL